MYILVEPAGGWGWGSDGRARGVACRGVGMLCRGMGMLEPAGG